jgi:hypothetical protein
MGTPERFITCAKGIVTILHRRCQTARQKLSERFAAVRAKLFRAELVDSVQERGREFHRHADDIAVLAGAATGAKPRHQNLR